MSKKTLLVFLPLLLLPALSLPALDFGLLMDQTLSMEGAEDGDVASGFGYSGTLIPWLSTPLGASRNGARLYLSIGLTAEAAKESANFIPELLRAELTFPIDANLGVDMEIKAGRMRYADPLGFVASGLFDGARFSLDGAGYGTFGIGAWYTGLLYKRSAQITMTGKELASYNAEIDYGDFAATYFAPARLLFALDWDNPYLARWLRLKAALIGQVDLSDSDAFHSQYVAVKATVPVKDFVFDLGACFELAQASGENGVAFAGEVCAAWMLPTRIRDRLALTGRFSSGVSGNGALAAFVPVTTEEQGHVLRAKLSGLSTVCLDYTARLHESFSISAASTYFILSDAETYTGAPSGRGGPALGNEFYGCIVWSPYSDLRLNFGGGAFLPSLGNADSAGKPIWLVELNAVLSIF
jgi:hypothetical protein